MVETNVISEIYPGHYFVILDWPTAKDLVKILDINCKYVWVLEHEEYCVSWEQYNDKLYGTSVEPNAVMVRNAQMEYLVETEFFIANILPRVKRTIHLIQTNTIPPYYLKLERFEGKSKYNMLKNTIDYRLEIEIPGATDYAPLWSQDKAFLEDVVQRMTTE